MAVRVFLVALLALASCAGTGFDPSTSGLVGSGSATGTSVDGSDGADGASGAIATGVPPTPTPLPAEVAVGSLPVGVEAGGGLIWVANSGDDTVAMIDPSTRAVVANVFVGEIRGPRAVGVSNEWAVVANTGDRSVTLIDVINRQPGATVAVGEDPVDVVVVGNEAWIANALGNSVSVVDLPTQTVQHLPVGQRPEGITFGEGRIFVTNLLNNNVTVFDQASRAGLVDIPVGAGPIEALYSAGQIFVTNGQEGTVSVISAATLTVTATIEVFGEPSAMTIGDDGLIWVIQRVGGGLKAIDPITRAVVREHDLGANSGGIAAIDGNLWISNADLGTVSILGQDIGSS